MIRREFYRVGTFVLGGLMGLALAVPGVAYLLDPVLNRRRRPGGATDEFRTLGRLNELPVGVPKGFPINEERQDAWVKYPREPVGLVWLVRQPEGAREKVVAFTAECPHLGCAVSLTADGSMFRCPCHESAFNFQGRPQNRIPPRAMDRLAVQLTEGPDPEVRVKFQRFRAQAEEPIPLV